MPASPKRGKPRQIAFLERLNGSFRDACPDEILISRLAEPLLRKPKSPVAGTGLFGRGGRI
jgi:hypothetical protein